MFLSVLLHVCIFVFESKKSQPKSKKLQVDVLLAGNLGGCPFGRKDLTTLELEIPRCYQQFFWYRYFATIRFNWAVGILVGITSLAGTPFYCKKGAGCIKKGVSAPFFPQNGGQCPLFEGKRGSHQINDEKNWKTYMHPSVLIPYVTSFPV
jgi:hypothetical protein